MRIENRSSARPRVDCTSRRDDDAVAQCAVAHAFGVDTDGDFGGWTRTDTFSWCRAVPVYLPRFFGRKSQLGHVKHDGHRRDGRFDESVVQIEFLGLVADSVAE